MALSCGAGSPPLVPLPDALDMAPEVLVLVGALPLVLPFPTALPSGMCDGESREVHASVDTTERVAAANTAMRARMLEAYLRASRSPTLPVRFLVRPRPLRLASHLERSDPTIEKATRHRSAMR